MSKRNFIMVRGHSNLFYGPNQDSDRYSQYQSERSDTSFLPQLQARQNTSISTQQIQFRQLPYTNRTRTSADDDDFNINPEPVPYQPQNFLSSTLLKKVPIPKRHLDSFGGYEYSLGSKRGVILHTDRYQWDAAKSLEGLSQRDRLRVELEYMERLRGIKRRREMLPHRAQLDLLMGGKKVEFSERFDLQREIQKLKSLILPKNARDLFHGRGFQLPEQHSSVHPRRPPTLDYDSDEDSVSAAHLKRSRTNIQNKYESMMNRSLTVPDGQEKQLKVSSKVDNVKRVDIATPDPPQKGRRSGKIDPSPVPDAAYAKLEIPLAGPPDQGLGEEVELDRQHVPSPVSDDSRRTGSPMKSVTPNPLKGSELKTILPEGQRDELKAVFHKLDTDDDGHVMYNQLKTQLPKQLSEYQERFLKQVYDITSSSTFFGIDEFMTMSTLSKIVNELSGDPAEAFNKLDFSSLHENILQYVDRFQMVDRGQRGKISLEGLQEILSVALEADLSSNQAVWDKIVETIDPDDGIKISKIEYLAHIPFFLSLKS